MSAQLVALFIPSTAMRVMQETRSRPAIRRDRVLYRTRVCSGVGSTDDCAADLEA